MNTKRWTEKRWLLPALCLVSLVAGWWYLSITTCAQLGGDDEIINLQNYYFTMHHSFWEVLAASGREILSQLTLQEGRFRPFASPPLIGLSSYFLGDLVGYRLYILFWTYLDVALTALLVGKATRNKALGVLTFCLLPLMFSVCQDATGNSLFTYGAQMQTTLLPFLVAGLCVLRRQSTGHRRWSVLAACCTFYACGIYEVSFVYIVPIFGIFWMSTEKVRPALRMSIPLLVGELVAMGYNLASRAANALRAAGVVDGAAADLGGVSFSLNPVALVRTWVMQMSAGFPLDALLAARVRPGHIAWSDLVCGVLLAIAVLVALALCRQYLSRRQAVLLFLSGLALLAAPALLVAASPKYQQPGNVDWRHGYIPQTVESFGVGLMAAALLLVLLRWARAKRWWPRARVAVSLVLAVGIAGSVVWQRAATRSSYAGGGRDYTVFGQAVAAGIAAPAGTEDPVVCDFMVWGGNLTAQQAFFLRYADTETNAHALQVWRTESHSEETVYRLGIGRGSGAAYDLAWFGQGADALLETVTDLTIYLPPQAAEETGVLQYTIRAADGTETACAQPARELCTGRADDGGYWLILTTGTPVVGDSIHLVEPQLS